MALVQLREEFITQWRSGLKHSIDNGLGIEKLFCLKLRLRRILAAYHLETESCEVSFFIHQTSRLGFFRPLYRSYNKTLENQPKINENGNSLLND